MIAFLLTLALLLLVVAVWLQLRQSHGLREKAMNDRARGADPPAAPLVVAAPKVRIEGTLPGHLAVLKHDQLLQVTGAQQLLEHLERRACVAKPVFERDLLPAVQRVAEFVQLMPASESHHHANVGGLLAHALETTYHALVLRAGYLLPRNGGAEIVDAQRDYWTYAVFFAALLHDAGKPLTDLRIEMHRSRTSEPTRWLPMAGSLNECQADQYTVKFAPKAERDYGAHVRLGMALMQRLVPSSALSFLGRCPDVLQELTQFLGGEARQGAIAEIVSKADQLSTKNNLAGGTRARFASARTIPLVEQLMGAMQEMLSQGGLLPLNRDGAAGWVYDGSVWFVAKRLADSVRAHVVARGGDEAGIPGEAKNDRLFDCWQEYGQIVPNPQTKQAIWHVVVHGEDGQGYSHALSVLRFPLDKVWPEGSSAYPPPMAGHIEVLNRRRTNTGADNDVDAHEPVPSAASVAASGAGGASAVGPTVDAIRAPRFSQGRPGKSDKREADAATQGNPDDFLPDDESASAGLCHGKPMTAAFGDGARPSPGTTSLGGVSAPGRVALHRRAAPPASAGGREPSEVAVAFMRWVQQGLADGSLKYNEAGAPVHFVESGMALISPAIFRDYALQFGEPASSSGAASKSGPERIGLSIQREVLRAGWHVPNPADGTNIWAFNVSRRGGTRTSRLSAVVLADAQRWVMEPPPPNPALQFPAAEAGGDKAAST